VPFHWDVDLTSGYEHRWLANRAPLPHRGRFGDYDCPEVADRIRSREFDAVLVHGWHARVYWQAMRACWSTGTPVYVRGDSQLRDDGSPWKRGAKRVVYPWFLRRFAACLSVGTRSEEYFRYYGARRIVRSPHFVDNEAFASAAAGARAAGRAGFGIAPGDLVVLFAGKLVPKKRPEDLITALERAALPRATALLAGDGVLREHCESAARKAGIRAVFAGFQNQSEMPKAYAAADVLVLPSGWKETWGLAVNEAMACGLPAFVSDAAGCAADLIIPGKTGATFPPGDVDRLAKLLQTDSGKLTVMGAEARRHVASFSAVAAADGIMQALGAPLC
jgi:glycosyltransferase involved in cell wall biosynthesis